MSERKERQGVDVDPELMNQDYSAFLEEIRNNLDPNSSTVLLVDDERAIRAKVARDIRQFAPDVVVYEAENGQVAMARLEEIRKKYYRDPSLIVLDLNMPIMDGWEVIELLRQEYTAAGKTRGIPIMVLSSTDGEKGWISRKSVHGGKSGYEPLVTVAKENCADRSRYDAQGPKGLTGWLKFFVKN